MDESSGLVAAYVQSKMRADAYVDYVVRHTNPTECVSGPGGAGRPHSSYARAMRGKSAQMGQK